MYDLDAAIRKVADFPKPGILFYDITSLLSNAEAFSFILSEINRLYPAGSFDCIVPIESRGFFFAGPLAQQQQLPIVPIRKKGKLPGDTIEESYALEYGTATVEIHKGDIPKGSKVLILDDLIATGGTLKAAANLVERCGAEVVSMFGVIGLTFLPYKELLAGYDIKTLIDYDNEKVG